MERLIKMRDCMREAADILDEFILIDEKEKNGEDVTKETESTVGRFMIKMAELQNIQNNL